MSLLQDGDPSAVTVHRTGAPAPFLFICDHAGRAIPRALGDLGVSAGDLSRHIGWDIGAAELTLRLAEGFKACAILQTYSRLVIDCNRHPLRPDVMPDVSDGVRIPGNVRIAWAEREARIAEIHRPYHDAIASELHARKERPPRLVCVHSFTPQLRNGQPRPWKFGVLHLSEPPSPFSQAMLQVLRESGEPVGDNQPYAMDNVDFTAPTHAVARGLDYLELEVRQDLLSSPEACAQIAAWLGPGIARAAQLAGPPPAHKVFLAA